MRGQSVASYVGNTPITVSVDRISQRSFSPSCGHARSRLTLPELDAEGMGLASRWCTAGDVDTEGAARQWAEIFDVGTSGHLLTFTNARFVL